MSKPDDIPQEIWDTAWKLQGDTRYDEVAFNGGSTAEILQACEDDAAAIARAIMDAKAEERDACAQIADAYAVQWHEADEGVEQEIVQEISDAIRSRS